MPGTAAAGYVMDVQAPLLDGLATRVVVPMIPLALAPAPIRELNPVFSIKGEPHVMLTQALATVKLRKLRSAEQSLDEHHDAITKALDVLFSGF